MKFLTIILVIAVAIGCQAYNGRWQDASPEREEQRSTEQRSTEQRSTEQRSTEQLPTEQRSIEHHSWQTNVDEHVSEVLSATQQEVASVQTDERWTTFANENPEAAPYQRKIVQRLQRSESLANKPNVQKNILNLALEKLNVCKSQTSSFNSIHHSCLGPFTGQMMQLITAIENVNRHHPGQ